MTRTKISTLWFFLWFAALSLNSVLTSIHAGHGHNICPHGEITHDESEGEQSPPQTNAQWTAIQAAHQHCSTSPWSRTLARMALSPQELIRTLPVTQFSHGPVASIAFKNFALTHEAPKNSPPSIV